MADVFVGRVSLSVPEKRTYRIEPLSIGRSTTWARAVDNGTKRPYALSEIVLCADTEAGRLILGTVPFPVQETSTDEDDIEKSEEELQAEQSSRAQLAAAQGTSMDGSVNYRAPREDVLFPDEVGIGHPKNKAKVVVHRGDAIVLDTGGLAAVLMDGEEGNTVIKAGSINLEVLPGLKMELGLREVNAAEATIDEIGATDVFTPGVSETTRERDKVYLRTEFVGDPEEDIPDLFLEAGRCPDVSDWGNGMSSRTFGRRLTRGFKARFGNFLDVEIDLSKSELRLSIVNPDTKARSQIRFNPDEIVLTRGAQFISFNDKGIFLRGDVLGLAGPWTMWGQPDLALFTERNMPETRADGTPFLMPACEWKDAANGAGVKFTRSAYFGAAEEPAVLQSFLTKTYARLVQDLAAHQHTTTAPGAPTSPPLPPPLSDWIQDGITYADPTGTAFGSQVSKIII